MNYTSNDCKDEMVEGAVLFVDIDDYMSQVRNLNAEYELKFANLVYLDVEKIALQFGFSIVRTFGDGFLMYRKAQIDDVLLGLSSSMLVSLRSILLTKNMSFKAALAAGFFIRSYRSSFRAEPEIILCGAILNVAGKKLARLDRGLLFCTWPTKNLAYNELTYDDFDSEEKIYKSIICEIDEAYNIPTLFCADQKSDTQSLYNELREYSQDSLNFSISVKTFTLETIKLADDKAKSVFAVSAAFLVYLFNGLGWPKIVQININDAFLRNVDYCILIFSMISFSISSAFAISVLLPRTGESYPGLIFFGAIKKWKSASVYARQIIRLDSDGLQRECAMHNYEIAKITSQKYKALYISIIWMVCGVIFSTFYFYFTWFFIK